MLTMVAFPATSRRKANWTTSRFSKLPGVNCDSVSSDGTIQGINAILDS